MSETIKYNTEKEHLTLSTYGRLVQDMVREAMKIEDRKVRNQCANTIIKVMGTLTGINHRTGEGQQKLWDHLAEIADYGLDIDYPVTITPKEERESRPEPITYPSNKIGKRVYGANLEAAMAQLAEMPDSPQREQLTALAANQMKRLLNDQNKEAANDERIRHDIEQYTDGAVTLPADFRFANPNAKCVQGSNGLSNNKKKKKK